MRRFRVLVASLLIGISASAPAATQIGNYADSSNQIQPLTGVVLFNPDGTVASLAGGGGGGGGGAVTAAANSYAAGFSPDIGTGSSPAATSLNGRLVTLNTTLSSTPAINNAQVGGVAVATGTGTANAGTQRVAVSSDSFPTGGATATNQTGTGTAAQTIQGATASGATDAGNPVKVGGVYNSTLPTFTTGQRGDIQIDTRGGVLTVIKGPNGTNQAAVSAPSNGASNTFGLVTTSQNTCASGSGTWDFSYDLTGATAGAGVGVCAVGMVPTSAISQGLQPVTVAPTTGAPSQVVKASPGNLYSINIDNAAVTGTYAIDYNAATAPSLGATLTASLILWHVLLGSGQTTDKAFPVPIYATNGHVLLFSTSLTTYTAPTTAPLLSTATFK